MEIMVDLSKEFGGVETGKPIAITLRGAPVLGGDGSIQLCPMQSQLVVGGRLLLANFCFLVVFNALDSTIIFQIRSFLAAGFQGFLRVFYSVCTLYAFLDDL